MELRSRRQSHKLLGNAECFQHAFWCHWHLYAAENIVALLHIYIKNQEFVVCFFFFPSISLANICFLVTAGSTFVINVWPLFLTWSQLRCLRVKSKRIDKVIQHLGLVAPWEEPVTRSPMGKSATTLAFLRGWGLDRLNSWMVAVHPVAEW